MKKLGAILITFIIISIALASLIHINILYHANFSKPVKSDVIIVLGCQVKGYSPSLSLQYRLEKALELYKENYASFIIVSGGQGKDEKASEASVMKSWLKDRGVDESSILEEDKSTSTFENLKYSKEKMLENNFSTAIIVSNDFHMFRSLNIARSLGIAATGAPAPTVYYLEGYYHIREILSVVKSFLMDK